MKTYRWILMARAENGGFFLHIVVDAVAAAGVLGVSK